MENPVVVENPWQSVAGLRAQELRTVQLAAGSGEVADFAREVAAGRASTRDLLYGSVLSDRALQPVRDLVERWHRLPPADRARLEAEGADDVADRIAALNTLPEVPEVSGSVVSGPVGGPARQEPSRRGGDDPEEGRSFLSDAW